MGKRLLLFILLAVLTGCGRKEAAVGNGSVAENPSAQQKESETDTETEAETEAETEPEAGQQETLTPKPEYDPYFAQRYNHPEEGYFNDYEYNYETDTWDLVYTNQGVRLIWHANSDYKVFIEYDGKRVELPWGSNNSYRTGTERRDMNGDGVEEFILWVDERGVYDDLMQIYDIANERDLSPLYYRREPHPQNPEFYLDHYFLRPEYAQEVMEFMNQEVFLHNGNPEYIRLDEDGSLNFLPYGQVGFYLRWTDGEEIENGLRISFYQMLNVIQWACDIEFCFDEEGVHLGRMEMTFYD